MAELTPQERLERLPSRLSFPSEINVLVREVARILVDQQTATQEMIRQALQRPSTRLEADGGVSAVMYHLHTAGYYWRLIEPITLRGKAWDVDVLRGYHHILRDARALLDALEQELPL